MFVKICGVTTPADLTMVAQAGADAAGLNFVPSSKRYLTLEAAEHLAHARPSGARRMELWGVFAGADLAMIERTVHVLKLDCVQLHGGESLEFLQQLRTAGIRAIRVQAVAPSAKNAAPLPLPAAESVEDLIMLDTAVDGKAGGTGRAFDWTQVTLLAGGRRVILAGGLTPDNVATAIAAAHPWGVDVAGGVCLASDPRLKDPAKVREFIARAQTAQP